MIGAITYIHKLLNFHATIAGPNDRAGFIDPPETGLHFTIEQKYINRTILYVRVLSITYIYKIVYDMQW